MLQYSEQIQQEQTKNPQHSKEQLRSCAEKQDEETEIPGDLRNQHI